MLLSFVLTMPRTTAWNGRWSGDGVLYARTRTVRPSGRNRDFIQKIIDKGDFTYAFGDGWVAAVRVEKITARKAARLRKDTQGFCGYDWMINSILMNGEIRA